MLISESKKLRFSLPYTCDLPVQYKAMWFVASPLMWPESPIRIKKIRCFSSKKFRCQSEMQRLAQARMSCTYNDFLVSLSAMHRSRHLVA